MELPQQRSFGAEGRKPTQDFLSLCGHSTVQPDPRTPSHGGGHLKTHDFLQPLERVEKITANEETNLEVSRAEKLPPPAAPPPGSVEHILPGGIGTYRIGHVSYYNHRGVPKPEGESMFTVAHQGTGDDRNEENSNCSSCTGSGFTLWEESAFKKGKTGKENFEERSSLARETASSKAAQWTTSERPPVSLSNNHRNSFSSFSSAYQPILSSGHTKQSFMEMIKSGKCSTEDDDFDEEEDFVLKRESPSPINKGELKVKLDGKNSEQKANTPRSKHSATEQRRRSKINDRFQMLREIIPHSDQKRDKASFLLEVIEYIQFLQVKVQKYEGSYQGWSNDPTSVHWRSSGGSAECYVDPSRGINGAASPALLFTTKLEEKNISVSPTLPKISQTSLESDMKSSAIPRSMDHHHGLTNRQLPFPLSLQPNLSHSGRSGGAVPQQPPRMLSDMENTATRPQSELHRSCADDGNVVCDKLKEKDLTIEGGTISISNVYSKGLLSTLTKALQNSGVDLSQASISVQIELGKRAHNQPGAPTSTFKDDNLPSYNQGTTRSRVPSMETNQALKKLKTVHS